MADKKIHWTQTPEGRKRMAALARAKHKSGAFTNGKHRKRKERSDANVTAAAPEIDEATFAYALGHIESWLGTYAAAAGVPASSLAARVGKVLHGKARG